MRFDRFDPRLIQFYEQCQAKGYQDMTDETQSLKAKVIAMDLKLPFDDIRGLYDLAKIQYENEQKRKQEEARQAEELEAAGSGRRMAAEAAAGGQRHGSTVRLPAAGWNGLLHLWRFQGEVGGGTGPERGSREIYHLQL